MVGHAPGIAPYSWPPERGGLCRDDSDWPVYNCSYSLVDSDWHWEVGDNSPQPGNKGYNVGSIRRSILISEPTADWGQYDSGACEQ
jgi:hypothetical protein